MEGRSLVSALGGLSFPAPEFGRQVRVDLSGQRHDQATGAPHSYFFKPRYDPHRLSVAASNLARGSRLHSAPQGTVVEFKRSNAIVYQRAAAGFRHVFRPSVQWELRMAVPRFGVGC